MDHGSRRRPSRRGGGRIRAREAFYVKHKGALDVVLYDDILNTVESIFAEICLTSIAYPWGTPEGYH